MNYFYPKQNCLCNLIIVIVLARATIIILRRQIEGNAIRGITCKNAGNLRPYETNFLHLLAVMSRYVTHTPFAINFSFDGERHLSQGCI